MQTAEVRDVISILRQAIASKPDPVKQILVSPEVLDALEAAAYATEPLEWQLVTFAGIPVTVMLDWGTWQFALVRELPCSQTV
jgi:hypothetical protein